MRNPRGVGSVGGWGRSLTPHTPHTPLPLNMREKSGLRESMLVPQDKAQSNFVSFLSRQNRLEKFIKLL
ncbi:MAG: hypothetical protein V7K61_31925 [Nostoc sp.]